jgi:DNA-binding CsgD family transcriptional regulator
LSRRELEVAKLLAADTSLKEIASHLFISVNTVKTHERNIFKKTGVLTRADLARFLEEIQEV